MFFYSFISRPLIGAITTVVCAHIHSCQSVRYHTNKHYRLYHTEGLQGITRMLCALRSTSALGRAWTTGGFQRVARAARRGAFTPLAATLSSKADLPESARVVIVGGGIIGTSVAYHLAHAGWKDVVSVGFFDRDIISYTLFDQVFLVSGSPESGGPGDGWWLVCWTSEQAKARVGVSQTETESPTPFQPFPRRCCWSGIS